MYLLAKVYFPWLYHPLYLISNCHQIHTTCGNWYACSFLCGVYTYPFDWINLCSIQLIVSKVYSILLYSALSIVAMVSILNTSKITLYWENILIDYFIYESDFEWIDMLCNTYPYIHIIILSYYLYSHSFYLLYHLLIVSQTAF